MFTYSHLSTPIDQWERGRSGSFVLENSIVYAMAFTICFIIQHWLIIGAKEVPLLSYNTLPHTSAVYTHGAHPLANSRRWINRSARFINQSWRKVLGQTYIFGAFSHASSKFIYTCSAPPPPPLLQCWTRVHAISPKFQHCIAGWGGGSNAS